MEPPKDYSYGDAARQAIKKGIDILADSVKVTLGPKGRRVIIDKPFGTPHTTKDGVTVAKECWIEDKVQNVGAQMVKEVAAKTVFDAGDGTTTATVLAQAIFSEGLKNIAAGSNPMEIKKGIDKAVQLVTEELKKISVETKGKEDISKVGTISANGDTFIGGIIADAMEKVGKDGVIAIEDAKGIETTLEVIEGTQFGNGYLSPHFVTNQHNQKCELKNPFILIYEKGISSLTEFAPFLDKFVKFCQEKGQAPSLLIIADNVDRQALDFLAINATQNASVLYQNVCAVRLPGMGDAKREYLQDLACLTFGKAITADLGVALNNCRPEDMGRASKVIVDRNTTTIIGGAGSKESIEARCESIREQIKKTNSDYEKEQLQGRLAKLVGGVAVISVGGITEIEVKERKDVIDDVLGATKAAVQEGIVPGGGVALIRAAQYVQLPDGMSKDERTGFQIIMEACKKPLWTIANNSGVTADTVVEKVETGTKNYGYNALTGQYEDLMEAGVIDPAKVVRCTLQNAASVCGLLLTAECVVTERPPKETK